MNLLKRALFFIYIISSFYFLQSCKSTSSLTKKNSDIVLVSDTLSDEQKFNFKNEFFRATQAYLLGDENLAESLYNHCLKIDPTSAATHYQLASLYLHKKDYSLAQQHAEDAVKYNSDNVWYLYLAGNIYAQNNEIDKAVESFNKLIKLKPEEYNFYLNLADIYIQAGQIENSIKVYDKIEKIFGISEPVSLQKQKLYISLHNKKAALAELQKLSGAFPSNVDYKRMIAEFYLQNKEVDKAAEVYNNLLKTDSNDGFAHLGLAECYRQKKDFNNSISELKMAFSADNVPSDVKFDMLLSFVKNIKTNDKYYNVLFDLAQILYYKYPTDSDIAILYANFLLQKGQLASAKSILSDVVKTTKDRYAVWEQLILLDNEFHDFQSMYNHADEAVKLFPNQSFLYFFKGFGAFQLKKYDVAVDALSFGIKLITDKDDTYKDYLTFLGEAYYQTGDKEKAFKTFDKLLKVDTDNIMVLNNYAYYLSLENKDLEKAAAMSKKTIEKEPENSTYLDTYAWILYKQKKYSEALIYIEKAIIIGENISDVVLEHYGDILYKNNNVSKALIQWKKAKTKGEGSGNLDKKINDKGFTD